MDFTNKNNGTENITEETFLITLDVKSLYSKIPNHGDIEAAKEALNSVPKKPIATNYYQISVPNINIKQFYF